ncbi:DUF2784 family protein [Phenylobacterium sp. SCN 70-31]|uniref:DUF2784 family protein n=1 Tax=Phenylobacterium sp. SCN 70-31 TaxID=1660129 RepID=UPI00086C322F|nr:DUF2784 family protein [Phenylobacterium sp. SCN 70-31]ODT88640.1 MAG: hypothetical protein ABS78_05620 [Phenylobacterium sp. SCN 70-31]
MSPAALGQVVLAVHVVVIAFNVAGLVLVPAGAAVGWRWVRLRWLRALHLGSLAAVALQAVLGRACFLTDWQAALTGGGAADPLIMRWVNGLIYWPLPAWVFAAGYVVVLAYVVALWRWIPPR